MHEMTTTTFIWAFVNLDSEVVHLSSETKPSLGSESKLHMRIRASKGDPLSQAREDGVLALRREDSSSAVSLNRRQQMYKKRQFPFSKMKKSNAGIKHVQSNQRNV